MDLLFVITQTHTSKLACAIVHEGTNVACQRSFLDLVSDRSSAGFNYFNNSQHVLTKYSLKANSNKFCNGIIFVCSNFITSEPYEIFNTGSFPNYGMATKVGVHSSC